MISFYIEYTPGVVENAPGKIREFFNAREGSQPAKIGHVDGHIIEAHPKEYAAFKAAYEANKADMDNRAITSPGHPVVVPQPVELVHEVESGEVA